MIARGPFWLDPRDGHHAFPEPRFALTEPNGLLAIGGDLAPARLLSAYRHGIFPWYTEDQPILWWTPDPRAVLLPGGLKVSRSLRKSLRKGLYRVTFDQAFNQVIRACGEPRDSQPGTWITPAMVDAYSHLHEMGYAHSVETWADDELVGGLYGVAVGKVFYGESMFSRRTDASKVAFVHLVRQLEAWDFALIDCQVASNHLSSLGAVDIARARFMALLATHCERPGRPGLWTLELRQVDS